MSDAILELRLYLGGGVQPGEVAMPCPCRGCMVVFTAWLPRALELLGEHLVVAHERKAVDRLVPARALS